MRGLGDAQTGIRAKLTAPHTSASPGGGNTDGFQVSDGLGATTA